MVVCYESKPGRVSCKEVVVNRLGTKIAEEIAAAVGMVSRIVVKRVGS